MMADEDCLCKLSDDCSQILETTNIRHVSPSSVTSPTNNNVEQTSSSYSPTSSMILTSGNVKKIYSDLFDDLSGELENIKQSLSANENQVLAAFNLQNELESSLQHLADQNMKLEAALQKSSEEKETLLTTLNQKNQIINASVQTLKHIVDQKHHPDNSIQSPQQTLLLQKLLEQLINQQNSLSITDSGCSLTEDYSHQNVIHLSQQTTQTGLNAQTTPPSFLTTVPSNQFTQITTPSFLTTVPSNQFTQTTPTPSFKFENVVPSIDQPCDKALCQKAFTTFIKKIDNLQNEICKIQNYNHQIITDLKNDFHHQYEKDQLRYDSLSKEYDSLKRQSSSQHQNNKNLNSKLIEIMEKCCAVEKQYCRLMKIYEELKRTHEGFTLKHKSLLKDFENQTTKLSSCFKQVRKLEVQAADLEKQLVDKSHEKKLVETELNFYKKEAESLKAKVLNGSQHEKVLLNKIDTLYEQMNDQQENMKMVDEKYKQMIKDVRTALDEKNAHMELITERDMKLLEENQKHAEFVREVKGLLDCYRSWKTAQVVADKKNQDKIDQLQEGIRLLVQDRQCFVDIFYDLHRDFEIVQAELAKYRDKPNEGNNLESAIPMESFLDRINLIHKTLFRILEAKEVFLPNTNLAVNPIRFKDPETETRGETPAAEKEKSRGDGATMQTLQKPSSSSTSMN